jgi:Trypsin-like peptidase domain
VIGQGPSGAGFFIQSPDDQLLYLCTCKHVIAETDEERQGANQIELVVSRLVYGQAVAHSRLLPLRDEHGLPLWRQHPDPNVDVFVLGVSHQALAGEDVHPVPIGVFPTANQLADAEVEPGDHVSVLGYPGGRTQYPSARPVYRGGVLGTPVIGHLRIRTPAGYAVVPAFWVDGMMVPGNSGSPVILRPERIRVDGQNAVSYPAVPYLLGMIVGCDYAQVGEIPAPQADQQDLEEAEKKKVYAGLALAMNVDTIKEVIALFEP